MGTPGWRAGELNHRKQLGYRGDGETQNKHRLMGGVITFCDSRL